MKYCPEKTKEFCDQIKKLKGRVGACKAVNIDYTTFLDWMRKKPAFSKAVKKAEDEADEEGKSIAIMSIFRAMPTQWQSGAWWLERKHNFVQKVQQNINADVKLTDDNARKKLISKLSSITAGGEEKQDIGGTD